MSRDRENRLRAGEVALNSGFQPVENRRMRHVAPLPRLATAVLIGILVHKIPSGATLGSLLTLAKKSPKQILFFVTGVALSAPIGLMGAAWYLSHSVVMPQISGVMLAASAGTFLYIATCDLIPEIHHNDHDKLMRLVMFSVGVLVAVLSAHTE